MTNTPSKGSPRIIERREHQTIISLGEMGHHGFPVAAYDIHNNELLVTVSNEALATLTYALAATKSQELIDQYMADLGMAMVELVDQMGDDTEAGEFAQQALALLGVQEA